MIEPGTYKIHYKVNIEEDQIITEEERSNCMQNVEAGADMTDMLAITISNYFQDLIRPSEITIIGFEKLK
jgi:hypothetical protein